MRRNRQKHRPETDKSAGSCAPVAVCQHVNACARSGWKARKVSTKKPPSSLSALGPSQLRRCSQQAAGRRAGSNLHGGHIKQHLHGV